MDETQAILDLERRRCAAIGSGNLEELAELLSDDYVHVYGTGRSSGRAEYIEGIGAAPRQPERGELLVRCYGEVAVITGELLNTLRPPGAEPRSIQTFATQVAVRTDGRWRFVSTQLTPRRERL